MITYTEDNLMKKCFLCSLCHNGILGGALYLDDNAVTYRTNKLTVAQEYRNLVLPLAQIQSVTWEQVLFPIATFQMADGRKFRFLIFCKSSFLKHYQQITNT